MNYSSIHKPSRLVLDKASKYLATNESFFLLNHDVNSVFGKATPLPANYLACQSDLPAGENYVVGTHYSQRSNEAYSWHYNSNGVHHIQRITETGECEIVYTGDCLTLSANPSYAITDWRALMDIDISCNKVPNGKLKRLIWTDGINPIASLDVEASIATDFFTTPFFQRCAEPCDYLSLCVPEVKGCLQGEWEPLTDTGRGKANMMLDKGLKFAIRHVYYDGRASEVSDRSTLYYQDAKGCFDNSEGFSRCIKFRIPIGNPMVEKIEFYFSEDGGLIWFLGDTIEKYKKYNSSQQYWYQRDLAENVSSSFSDTDCAFDYIFCNDKQRISADPKLFIRVTNPIPREAQGIFRIKDTIAAYNYVVGTCPIDKSELDKISIGMNCENTTSCNSEWATVTARAIIYNPFPIDTTAKTAFVYRSGGAVGAEDDLTDIAHFGMGVKAYEQSFKGEVRNFLAYIEGTNYTGEMKQWKATPGFAVGNRTEVGILSGVLSSDEIERVKQDIANGNFYYQEYKFKVPRGMKGNIRLASHYQTNAIGSNQNTSTQVVGILPAGGLATHTGSSTVSGYNENIREIYFDTCGGDVDNQDAFIISDLIYEEDQFAFSGYITDENSQPVAGARIYANSEYKSTTDFNGFYFFADNDGTQDIAIHVEQDCISEFSNIDNFGASSIVKQMAHVDREIDSDTYKDNFIASVDVLVEDCNSVPVGGVRVAISGGKYKITDSDGIAHFKLRNYNSRNRSVVAVVMDKNNCFTLDCFDGCNPCMPATASLPLASCFQTNPEYSVSTTSVLNTSNLIGGKRGLKSGGLYEFAIVLEGDCGRISAAYPLTQFNVPKIQETGGFSVCEFDYNTNGAMFPLWANRAKFLRSTNQRPYTLQWVVDSIDRTIDNKIILTIQSLNDYNTQFNFKTNTVYKFAAGDRVEFIKNGDGQVFDTATYGVLNFQILSPFNDEVISGVTDDVNYFNQIQIVDNGKLDGLEEGAIIEIQPISVSSTQVTFFEFCAGFEIENGEPLNPIGTFQSFDTFLVNRQIGSFPPQYFEHKSPSDFWGETTIEGLSTFLSDVGKAHFLNPFENERRYERNISINAVNQLNYFGDFVKTLDAAEQGYITAIWVKDDKIGLAICQNDNFLFEVSDDLLRVSSNGIVVAAPADSIISNPQPKIRGEYGCLYEDIGSIYFGDSFAVYCDARNNAFIIHNYAMAQMAGLSINQENGLTETSCNSFFQKRMRGKANFNKTASNVLDHYRWIVGLNKTTNVIYLTIKSLRQQGVNNGKAMYELPNETIMYSPISDAFLGMLSATPEGYSQLNLSTETGCSILMFQNSLPYITPVISDRWNEFFGITADWIISITLNKFPEKVKIPLSVEIQSDTMFFAHKVTTDKPNFISEVPPIRVKQSNSKWNFALLNNINSRGGLYNGENARGYYTDIVLCRDNSLFLAYNSINPEKRVEYSEIDSILVKFQLAEQAGYTENL